MSIMEIPVNANLTQLGKEIADRLIDTRKRELELIADLNQKQLVGTSLNIVEPPIWELGHVGWFQDRWILQQLDNVLPTNENANSLYDSFNIKNEKRWELSFPSKGQTFEYISDILDKIILRLGSRDLTKKEIYFYKLVLNHEEMHSETMHHIRHTLSYKAPYLPGEKLVSSQLIIDPEYESHDVEINKSTFMLGGTKDIPFLFDNEKWSHSVDIPSYKISTTPVTFSEFQKFVDAGAYQEKSLWSDEGLEWLTKSGQKHPVYWKKDIGGDWLYRWFDLWKPLSPFLPIVNVNWYEANAYSKWANRRLPTEAEWELAANASRSIVKEKTSDNKSWFPWGNQHPETKYANLNSITEGIIDVRALPEGDSAFGMRQMIGNVWEWTASTFNPYPGYEIDPYDTYSEPSFGQQKVLRGGCWATRPHVIRNTFRNFYTPNRNNIFAGFRTVAI